MRKEIVVMRVLRVPPLGKLVVEADAARLQSVSDVTTLQSRQRLLAAIGELITFAGGYEKLVEAGVAPALETAAVEPPPVGDEAPETSGDPRLAAQQARFLAQLEAQRDQYREGPRPATAPLPTPPPEPGEPTAGLGLVSQIDAILQQHVAQDSALAGRSIHLVKNPAGGLRIEVDGRYYDRPREIPELHIQAVIKTALKEWENQ